MTVVSLANLHKRPEALSCYYVTSRWQAEWVKKSSWKTVGRITSPSPLEEKTAWCTTCSHGEHYIAETERALGKRLGEHHKETTSAVWEHQSKASHEIDWEEAVKVLHQETVDKEKSKGRPFILDASM